MSNEIGWGGGPAPGFTTPASEILDIPDIAQDGNGNINTADINQAFQQLINALKSQNTSVSSLSTLIASIQTTLLTFGTGTIMQVVHKRLTETDLAVLNGTPVILVPAIPNKTLIPVGGSVAARKLSNLTVAWSGGCSLNCRYQGNTTNLFGSGMALTALFNATPPNPNFTWSNLWSSGGVTNDSGSTDFTNLGLQVVNTSPNPTVAGTAEAYLTLVYFVTDTFGT